jgi:hypothetical protein
MVIGQIAVAVVMLIGTGFDSGQIVQGRIDFMSTYHYYPERAEAANLKRRIHTAMKQIPGVDSVLRAGP